MLKRLIMLKVSCWPCPPLLAPRWHFARAIREGREPETSLEKALVVQKITDAIYASAAQGKAVEIE